MKKFLRFIFVLVFSISSGYLHAQQPKKSPVKTGKKEKSSEKPIVKYGIASFYAPKFHGRKTANGEIHSKDKYTAACNVLPLNTWIKVTNLRNKRTVIVKINDRMHPKNKRLLDLSKSAAAELGFISRGIAKVKLEVLPGFKPPKIKN